jgi:hypothetical protein
MDGLDAISREMAQGVAQGVAQRLPPRLRGPIPASPPLPERQTGGRTRLWELPDSLHCSVIGTCLTAAELRQLMGRLGLVRDSASDHDLHSRAVALAGRAGQAARLLEKALDQRHRLDVARFERAGDEAAVRVLWRAARERGEIPGAYWATLTHPASTRTLIGEAFGDVHMLSHLLGAAGRADLHRLAALEAETQALRARLADREAAMQAALAERDATIRALNARLAFARQSAPPRALSARPAPRLASRQEKLSLRLSVVEQRLAEAEASLKAESATRAEAEQRATALAAEIAALRSDSGREAPPLDILDRVAGLTVLYVGGRPSETAHVRARIEQLGGTALHHDGGIEESLDLLAGLVSRADIVLFPVDCVSHAAVGAIKRACMAHGKPYQPLRSTGVAAVAAGLSTLMARPSPAVAGCC